MWGPTKGKEKTNGLAHVKTGVGDQPKEKENKWISTGKNRGGGTYRRKRENKWINTGKMQGWGTNLRKRENEWIRGGGQVKTGGGGPT